MPRAMYELTDLFMTSAEGNEDGARGGAVGGGLQLGASYVEKCGEIYGTEGRYFKDKGMTAGLGENLAEVTRL